MSEIIDINSFPENDADWSEKNWKEFMEYMVQIGIISHKEIASAILSTLNPPQVGTGVASKKSFQAHFPPRKTMQAVFTWFYKQAGTCEDCGTRMELQADHINPRENFTNADDADTLDNLELRCRRCNVIKRPSHKKGGLTFLTTASALMWILFTKKPKTYNEYHDLCRSYGLTMANIRFQEAWAIAIWMNKDGKYEITEG